MGKQKTTGLITKDRGLSRAAAFNMLGDADTGLHTAVDKAVTRIVGAKKDAAASVVEGKFGKRDQGSGAWLKGLTKKPSFYSYSPRGDRRERA